MCRSARARYLHSTFCEHRSAATHHPSNPPCMSRHCRRSHVGPFQTSRLGGRATEIIACRASLSSSQPSCMCLTANSPTASRPQASRRTRSQAGRYNHNHPQAAFHLFVHASRCEAEGDDAFDVWMLWYGTDIHHLSSAKNKQLISPFPISYLPHQRTSAVATLLSADIRSCPRTCYPLLYNIRSAAPALNVQL